MPSTRSRRPAAAVNRSWRRDTGSPRRSLETFLQGTAAFIAVVTGAVFWRGTREIFNLPRATLIALTAVAVSAVALVLALRSGRVKIPASPAVLFGVALVVALGLATALAHRPTVALVGPYGRYTGLAMYASYAVMLTVVIGAHRRATIGGLAWAGVGALGIVAAYGLLQILGLDPLSWPGSELSTDFSTLGQTNFAAAYVAITLPLAMWALLGSRRRVARVGFGLLVVAASVFLLQTGSFQGPAAAVAGLVPLAAAWSLERRQSVRSRRLREWWPLIGAVALVGAAVAITGVMVLGGELDDGLHERTMLWEAAASMIADSPVWGHGPGAYEALFPEHRPRQHAVEFGLATADAPHSVPLAVGVAGGGLALLAYLGLVGYTGRSLVTGIRSGAGGHRLLMGALGGGWLAYQVQSVVSIDVPALAVWHWLLTGAVVVLSRDPGWWTWRLPARGRQPVRRSPTDWPAHAVAGSLVIVATAGLLAWSILMPLRADVAAKASADAALGSDVATAIEGMERAGEVAWWEGTYRADAAALYLSLGRPGEAFEAAQEAAWRSPGQLTFALGAAQLALQLGDSERAEQWLAVLFERTDRDPRALFEAGRLMRAAGQPQRAVEWLEEAVDTAPPLLDAWLELGRVRRSQGDLDGAREAWARVLELDPDNAEARESLTN